MAGLVPGSQVLGRISFAMAGKPLAVVEVPLKDPSMVVRSAEPYNAGPPLETLRTSLLTPVQLFFVRNHGTVPVVDAAAYRLTVTGLVDRELQLSLAALQREFTPSTVTATIQCAGNRRRELNAVRSIEGEIPWDAEAVGTATWTGVPLGAVLQAAGVRALGRYVHLLGLDTVATDTQGFGGSIPLEKAMSPEVLLAYEMNGSPLLPVHGFPLRVVVPGYIGARSVKWLRSISVAAEPSRNYFQSHAYKWFPPHVLAQTVDWTAGLTLTEPPVSAVIDSLETKEPTQIEVVPPVPESIEETGIPPSIIEHLILKFLYFRGEVIGRLLGETRQLVADYAELTILDARRAAIRLAWILGTVLVAAVLVVTSWMGLVAASIVFAWGHGASWPIALGIAALVNLVTAAALGWFTLKLAKELPFTALLRQLRGRDPEPPQ